MKLTELQLQKNFEHLQEAKANVTNTFILRILSLPYVCFSEARISASRKVTSFALTIVGSNQITILYRWTSGSLVLHDEVIALAVCNCLKNTGTYFNQTLVAVVSSWVSL